MRASFAVTAAGLLAIVFTDASPVPDVGTLFDYVYATPAASSYQGLPGDPVTGPAGPGEPGR